MQQTPPQNQQRVSKVSDYLHTYSDLGAQGKPDPTDNLTFNLKLTEEEQAARESVVLPYRHHLSMHLSPNFLICTVQPQESESYILVDEDELEEDLDDDLDI